MINLSDNVSNANKKNYKNRNALKIEPKINNETHDVNLCDSNKKILSQENLTPPHLIDF